MDRGTVTQIAFKLINDEARGCCVHGLSLKAGIGFLADRFKKNPN